MNFLAKIVARKLDESEKLFKAGVAESFKAAIAARPRPVSLKRALDQASGTAIIAEVKRASPSKGEFAMGWDPVDLAVMYQQNGAAAISVLTERHYFKGDPDFIRQMRSEIHIPILRKDFILEPIQVYETAALGADALLLIVNLLNLGQLTALLLLTRSLGLEALVEVHTAEEMARALQADARLIGINHRDLNTFEMHPDRAVELAPMAPPGVTLVAASGLNTRADLERLEAAGIRAFLIGETIVTAPDPGAKLRELLGKS
ncbi:MAG: indole-3-glycerol phosphate synthase TrpC [Deltaproteobacteria bacterium]|nr:indole-3-glycerol phosphate synthase TrpC [Deltaproteobacteria bacterium]